MKLCISNIAWDKVYDDKMYKACSDMGYDGIEIAPTRVFPENTYEHIEDARSWLERLESKYGLRVYSCQSIWYGRKENIFENAKERNSLLEYSKKAFGFISAIKAKNVVFGCPKNRNGYTKSPAVNEAIAIDFFGKLAESADEYDITLSIEPNPNIYGTDFLNTTGGTIRFIEQLRDSSLKLNLDMGTMLYNHEDMGILKGYEDRIGHVHISEPHLQKVMKRREHNKIFEYLRSFNYGNAVSIEMGKQNKVEDIYETMRYIYFIFKDNTDERRFN